MAGSAIFAADLHISDYIWATHPTIRGDSYFALNQAVDIAIGEQVPLVLAGDVLELMRTGSPTSQTVQVVNDAIARMRAAELPVYYIHGQHDLAWPSWLHAINPWATDVNCDSFAIGDEKWYGIGYHSTETLGIALEGIPDDAVGLVVHQQWTELSGGSSSHGSLRRIFDQRPNLRAIVTGDLHETIVAKYKDRLIVSPGATHIRTVAEPDEHFVIHWDDGVPRKVRLKGRPIIRLSIQTRADWAAVKTSLARRVEEAESKALMEGVDPVVSMPLVIVHEANSVGAYIEAVQLLEGQAHVLRQAGPLTDKSISDEADEMALQHQAVFDSRVNRVKDTVRVWSEARFGVTSPTNWIVQGILEGASAEELRERFLKGYQDGDS